MKQYIIRSVSKRLLCCLGLILAVNWAFFPPVIADWRLRLPEQKDTPIFIHWPGSEPNAQAGIEVAVENADEQDALYAFARSLRADQRVPEQLLYLGGHPAQYHFRIGGPERSYIVSFGQRALFYDAPLSYGEPMYVLKLDHDKATAYFYQATNEALYDAALTVVRDYENLADAA